MLGPLENADLVGTDLTLAIHETVLSAIESRPGPSPYLQKLVADGKLGFKSGEGFRKWSADEQAALRAKVSQHLKATRDEISPVIPGAATAAKPEVITPHEQDIYRPTCVDRIPGSSLHSAPE